MEVSLMGHALDYPRRFREVVDDLAMLERRPVEQIVKEIRTSASDLFKIRLSGAELGRISVDQGARAFQRARDLLLAAACTAVERRAVYWRRKPDAARELLSKARFGPTDAGSFVLTVETAVPPLLDPWPGRKIKVILPGATYRQAAVAHGAGDWISCEGDLVRQGSLHALINPRNFRVLTEGGFR